MANSNRLNNLHTSSEPGIIIDIGTQENGSIYQANIADASHIIIGGSNKDGKSNVVSNIIKQIALFRPTQDAIFIIFSSIVDKYRELELLPHIKSIRTSLVDLLPDITWINSELDYRIKIARGIGRNILSCEQRKIQHLLEIFLILDDYAALGSNLEIDPATRQIVNIGPNFGIHCIFATKMNEPPVVTKVLRKNVSWTILCHGDYVQFCSMRQNMRLNTSCFNSLYWQENETSRVFYRLENFSNENLLAQAVDVVTKIGACSQEILHSYLGVDSNTAKELISQLEDLKVVSKDDGIFFKDVILGKERKSFN